MKIMIHLLVMLILLGVQNLSAQEEGKSKIEILKNHKEQAVFEEKEALKKEVKIINKRLESKEINDEEAKNLKRQVANKHALNIENKTIIIENKIALIERNGIDTLEGENNVIKLSKIVIGIGAKEDNDYIFGIKIQDNSPKKIKYDYRTQSDLIITFGLNNALIDNQSFDDSPYQIGGSRFFELGWAWRTRVFKNSNFLRINYGLSFQFNGLKPKDNQYFVAIGNKTELQNFEYDLKKSKLRMDNLVFPIHFEIGSSKVKKTEHTIRYSTHKQFKFGFGGYAGFNLSTRQKLKYKIDNKKIKDKIKRDYNTSNLIYGLSFYAGYDNTMLYLKYDLNPIFKNADVEQHNISLGLRFHL